MKINHNNRKLLTAAIPTFNRASFLKICLNQIKKEFDGLEKDRKNLFEILISNNKSTDETELIISEFIEGYCGGVTVINNKENIGGDKNIVQCYTMSVTNYVWIIGDDDVILPGGLNLVLSMLIDNSIDILSVECKPFSDFCTDFDSFHLDTKSKFSIFNRPEKFTKRTNVYLTFISSIIIRTNYCNEASVKIAENSNLSQMCWVTALLIVGNKFAIIHQPVIGARKNNSGGYELVKVFGHNLQFVTRELLKAKPKLIKIIQNGVIVNFFPNFIVEMRRGRVNFVLNNDSLSILHKLYKSNLRYYIFIVPLVILPLFVAKIYIVLIKIFRRILRRILI